MTAGDSGVEAIPGANIDRVFWIASYPRSGNTWLRFLLTNLLSGTVTHSDQVATFVQDIHVHQRVTFAGSTPKLLKTHWKLHDRFPFADRTVGAIYLIRHPADVLESAVNFYFLQGHWLAEDMTDEVCERRARTWIQDYIALGGRRSWIDGNAGRWAENVESWVSAQAPFRCTVIRYEDLRADPTTQLRTICGLLGKVRSDSAIEQAIARSDLRQMSRMEEAEIAANRPGLFNNEGLKGKTRGYRQVRSTFCRIRLTEEEREKIVTTNESICRRFGYHSA
jgi:hypothetical protein